MDSLIFDDFSIAISVVLAMYWTSAMVQMAPKNAALKPLSTMWTGAPMARLSTATVKKVEVARIAELNRIVRGRLLIINVAAMPSSADMRIAAAPPKSNIVRKTNVSATVMRPLTRGILIATSELAITIRHREKKRASRSRKGNE